MLLEDLKLLAQVVAWFLLAVFLLVPMPFVLLKMYGDGQEEDYPHSGFCPDCPVWEAPLESAAGSGEEVEP